MKIFIVCSNLRYGGAERVAATLANGFLEYGYKVVIVTNLFEKINYPLHKGIIVENLVATNDNKLKKWSSAIPILHKHLKKHLPNLVIGIMPTCSFIARIATIGMKIPVIATEHNSFERPPCAPMSLITKISKFQINKIYQHITVLTQADKIAIGNRFKHLTVMPNPLFLTPTLVIPPKDNYVLAAGRIDDWHYKGFDILIKSWKKIQDLNDDDNLRDWWLKIAGTGKQENFEYLMNLLPDGNWIHNEDDDDNHKDWIWRSEKYHIEFLGFRKDMEKLYQEASIFVLSSRYEGFGLVLIEAMSQGCACVACDYKGRQREILSPLHGDSLKVNGHSDHGIEMTENGILCEPDNVEALVEAIKKMIENDDYRENVCKNAIERSKFYSIENTMGRWDRLLHDVRKS